MEHTASVPGLWACQAMELMTALTDSHMQHLANASQTRRPTSCLMVLPKPVKAGDDPDEEVTKMYKEVRGKMSKLETA